MEIKQYEKELCPPEEVQGKAKEEDCELMKTIKMPKKLHFLQERLPKPKYQLSVRGIAEEEEEDKPEEEEEYYYQEVEEEEEKGEQQQR